MKSSGPSVPIDKEDLVISVQEYRELLNDYLTSDERVIERIAFLQSFVGNIIRHEIEKLEHPETESGSTTHEVSCDPLL
jgi:hypothetical protein